MGFAGARHRQIQTPTQPKAPRGHQAATTHRWPQAVPRRGSERAKHLRGAPGGITAPGCSARWKELGISPRDRKGLGEGWVRASSIRGHGAGSDLRCLLHRCPMDAHPAQPRRALLLGAEPREEPISQTIPGEEKPKPCRASLPASKIHPHPTPPAAALSGSAVRASPAAGVPQLHAEKLLPVPSRLPPRRGCPACPPHAPSPAPAPRFASPAAEALAERGSRRGCQASRASQPQQDTMLSPNGENGEGTRQ